MAVIGASGSEGKPGNVVLRNMLDNTYEGQIFLVNPRGGEIEGRPVARSIDDLPAGIDQAVVTLPAGLVPETVLALGEKRHYRSCSCC